MTRQHRARSEPVAQIAAQLAAAGACGDIRERDAARPPWRVVVAVPVAMVVTFALFWGMQALITVSGKLDEAGETTTIEFVRLKRDEAPETKKREKPQRDKPDRPPPPEMKLAQNFDQKIGTGNLVAVGDPTLALDDITAVGSGGSDQDVQPLVRVATQYPPRAMQRGIEGWVELVFTVTAAGTVTDVRVTASFPGSIFDQAAIDAVRRWKYSPRMQNGVAVERKGARTRISFDLEDT